VSEYKAVSIDAGRTHAALRRRSFIIEWRWRLTGTTVDHYTTNCSLAAAVVRSSSGN